MKISDNLELRIAELLTRKAIKFVHEGYKNGINQRLDFYLPDHDIYIEVKKFHTDRVLKQLESQDNIILVQGDKSVKFLEGIL